MNDTPAQQPQQPQQPQPNHKPLIDDSFCESLQQRLDEFEDYIKTLEKQRRDIEREIDGYRTTCARLRAALNARPLEVINNE